MSSRLKRSLAVLAAGVLALAGGGAALAAEKVFGQSLLEPAGPQAEELYKAMMFDIYGTAVLFVVISLMIVYAIFRFRDGKSKDLPPQVDGNRSLEVGWALALVAGLVIFLVHPVKAEFIYETPPEDPEAIDVKVIGHQWWWEFQYPQMGITTANELIIPAGRVVRLSMTSDDVMHSLGVPRLGGKDEAMPGRVTRMWIKADEPGNYQGQCMQLCGKSHARMYFRVVARDRRDFDAWVEQHRNPKVQTSGKGYDLFMQKCAACHTIDGTPAKGRAGPNLTYMGHRTSIGGGIRENTPENLAAWIESPQSLKPGAFMPGAREESGPMPPNQSRFPATNLSKEDVQALVDFLEGMK